MPLELRMQRPLDTSLSVTLTFLSAFASDVRPDLNVAVRPGKHTGRPPSPQGPGAAWPAECERCRTSADDHVDCWSTTGASATACRDGVVRRWSPGETAIARWAAGVLQDSTKGGEGAEVPLTPRLVQALQALKEEGLDRTWVLPRRTKREPEPGGTHADDRYLGRTVTALEIDAGLPGYGPHRIRHSRLTHLAERGLPLRALQHLARHADEATTARYYIHVDKMKMAAMAVDAITAMTAMIEPPPPPSGNGLETKRKRSRIALVA